MVRTLKTFGVLALISSGVVSVLCVFRQLQGAQEIEWNQWIPIFEKFSRTGSPGEKSGQKPLTPLVRQAEAFALYLNPPQPAKPEGTPAPKHSLKQTTPVVRPAKSKPKFTLIGTSYYRSRPEESMALMSEPGSEAHWVKQGAHLGHFVVEKVERGTIVYRDGDRLREMAVNTKVPVNSEQVQQTKLASSQENTSPSRSSVPSKPDTRPRKKLQRLGPARPETRLVAYYHERRGSG